MAEGSRRLSLVSRGDRDRILMRHVRECLEPALINRISQESRWIDIGSGGGLPGIPVALMRGDLEITLLEPRERKASFLERTILTLGLENVVVEQKNLEDIPRGRPGKTWDVATARALAWTPKMVKSLEAILTLQGTLIRFGADQIQIDGVEAEALPLSPGRAVQFWPQATWASLPNAS